MSRTMARSGLLILSLLILAGACRRNPAGAPLAEPQQPFLFERAFGGERNDVGNAVLETADGGFLVTGYTASHGAGGTDLWLIRTDRNGDTLWTRTVGGPADDYGWDVEHAEDGGFAIVGFTASWGAGGEDVWLVRIDERGDTLWTRTFGGDGDERAWSLAPTGDGGWVIAGQAEAADAGDFDLFLVRTDAEGEVVWITSHSGPGEERVFDVARVADGGFVFAGTTSDSVDGARDVSLVRVGDDGMLSWQRRFGGEGDAVGHGLVVTPEGGFLVVGYGEGSGVDGSEIYLVRTDADGRELWSQRIGDEGEDRAMMGVRSSMGGYVIAGYTSTEAGDSDAYVVKVDEDGEPEWSERFGAAANDRGMMVGETRDGGYVLTGSLGVVADEAWDVMLVKFRAGED